METGGGAFDQSTEPSVVKQAKAEGFLHGT